MKELHIPFPNVPPEAALKAFQLLSDTCTKIGCKCELNEDTISITINRALVGPETIFTLGAIWGQELASVTLLNQGI